MSISLQDLKPDPVPDISMSSSYSGTSDSDKLVTPSCMTVDACSKSFWVTFIVAVIVLVILLAIAHSGKEWYDNLNNDWSWTKEGNSGLMAVFLVVVLLLVTYVSYVVYMKAASYDKWWIGLLYLAIAVLLIAMFAVFYTSHKIYTAFWLSLAVLALAVVHTYFVWKVDSRAAFGMVPFLIWAAMNSSFLWHLHKQNDEE